MKRDLSVVDEWALGKIKEWLKTRDDGNCPFLGEKNGCGICEAIFPTLENNKHPCEQFGIQYVTRVAKQVVKAAENGKVI